MMMITHADEQRRRLFILILRTVGVDFVQSQVDAQNVTRPVRLPLLKEKHLSLQPDQE